MDLQLWRRHRNNPCCVGGGCKISVGMLALSQKTETSANPFRIHHSDRESSDTSFSHFRAGYGETRSEVYRHSNVPHSEKEKFYLNIEISAISLNCELA